MPSQARSDDDDDDDEDDDDDDDDDNNNKCEYKAIKIKGALKLYKNTDAAWILYGGSRNAPVREVTIRWSRRQQSLAENLE